MSIPPHISLHPVIGYRLEQRIVPVHNFTQSDDQHPARGQSLGQQVKQVAAAPTSEVDEQVLAKDDIQIPYGSLGQFQDVKPGKADSVSQCRDDFQLAALDRPHPAGFLGFGQPTQAVGRITRNTRLFQRLQADVGGPEGVIRRFPRCAGQALFSDQSQRIGLFATGAAQAPQL